MPSRAILRTLEGAASCRTLRESLALPGLQRATLPDSALPLVLAYLWHAIQRPLVLVVPTPEDARRLGDDLALLVGTEALAPFPETEALPYERLAVDERTVQRRLATLHALLRGGTPPPLVVASAQALLHRLPPRDAFATAPFLLRPGMDYAPEALARRLVALGYQSVATVEGPGTFSRRGGILDIFPPGAPAPVRLDFFGNTIETLRTFDPLTQRSTGPCEAVEVIPAREVLPALVDTTSAQTLLRSLDADDASPALERIRDDLSRLFAGESIPEAGLYAGFFNPHAVMHYLPPQAVLVVLRPHRVAESALAWEAQAEALRERRQAQGDIPPAFPRPHLQWEEVRPLLDAFPTRLHLDPWGADQPENRPFLLAPTEFSLPPAFAGKLDAFLRWLQEHRQQGGRTVLVTHHTQRLATLLVEQGIAPRTEGDMPLASGEVLLVSGALSEGVGVAVPEGALVVLTDRELFGVVKRARLGRTPPPPSPRRAEALLADITPGRYVVHAEYGIGRFLGIQRRQVGEATRDYLVLEYAEGARLFVPVEQIDQVSPYYAPTDQPPPLSRLGSPEWAHTKQRVRSAVREMAKELLDLYAARQVVPGHAFSPDTPWQRQLEDAFPYVETPDQLAAIEETKRDMETPRPMDRLICGDVGFGKTEVAVRAAFKAIMDGKQVAVLVPTTILAQQHYETFRERYSPFPVRIAMLSRLTPPEEQKRILEGLARGEIDLVIGTHRLLSKDVRFKDLGLVVIDDEHRFGVAHKERLKRLRTQVDVLTMTATPIPRTLGMALGGLRAVSLIRTPPEMRQPVKTFVSEYSDDLVREAILRELARNGQVFYLHNRIRDIHAVARRLGNLVPQARIAVAHGRMAKEALGEAVERFRRGDVDILVCTTIIEAGLDLPNANTIIVERAHLLGLAQMHQLRGRVGRGGQQAYAYFLVPKGVRLTPEAEARLKAILSASELGAGFRIAMKDLEIRGAGNLLGPQQSGHIYAVGWDLYLRMLQEAVEELKAKGEGRPWTPEESPLAPRPQVTIDLPLSAYLPHTYVPDQTQRVALYQRMAEVTTLDGVRDLEEELNDRFGPLPAEVQNLLQVLRWRALALQAGVHSIAKEGDEIVLRLREPVGGARPALEKRLAPVARVGPETVRLPLRGRWEASLTWVLERLATFRQEVLALAGAGPPTPPPKGAIPRPPPRPPGARGG
ncbi:MAG: transcription-repair coupling factor [Dehalococcoidia bacterium]|nr:transcription-repair coupling factor [Dehalococcoidia bacterium]